MGAQDFYVRAHGATPEAAFSDAVSEALYEYGHRGYTGTIAEKHGFVMFRVPEGTSASRFALDAVHGESDGLTRTRQAEVASDKWGPACCVELTGEELAKARDEYERSRGYTTTYAADRSTVLKQEKHGPEPDALRFFLFFGRASC